MKNVTASPRLWLFLCAAGICACGFAAVAVLVFHGAGDAAVGATPFDQAVAQSLQQYRTRSLTGRVMELSALGSAPVLAVLALLAYSVVLRARDRLGFFHLSIALAGAAVFSRLVQGMFERERPEGLLPFIVVTDGSFPSAHLFGAAATYLTFAFFYARYAPGLVTEVACYAAACVIVVIIGMTRIYLGAHHATDVISGIAAGAAWAFLVAAAFSAWGRRSNAIL